MVDAALLGLTAGDNAVETGKVSAEIAIKLLTLHFNDRQRARPAPDGAAPDAAQLRATLGRRIAAVRAARARSKTGSRPVDQDA